MKRIVLFLLTNFAVLIVFSIVVNLLGLRPYITEAGLDYGALLAFCAVFGFTGSIISLLFSKTMAKFSTGAKVIEMPRNEEEAWLKTTVSSLASKAGLPTPEVAIYHGAPNAFATGPSKSNSLVAVSDGLLASMDKRQVEAVLAHEMTHISNGDMVTLVLIQGVVNTFVLFFARVAAYAVDGLINKNSNDSSRHGPSFVFYICDIVFQLLFGFLAGIIVCLFSRKREYRADAGAVKLMGSNRDMIDALRTLGKMEMGGLPKSMAASGIAGVKKSELFSTHPTIENRIAALEKNGISAWN